MPHVTLSNYLSIFIQGNLSLEIYDLASALDHAHRKRTKRCPNALGIEAVYHNRRSRRDTNLGRLTNQANRRDDGRRVAPPGASGLSERLDNRRCVTARIPLDLWGIALPTLDR